MPYVIAEPCIDVMDRSCIDECPVDCIYPSDRMLVIHPEECVDCGACEPACPVEAIYYQEELPEKWRVFADAGRSAFVGIGNPGGAAGHGPIALVLPPVRP